MATADDEYDHSRSATAPLVLLITEQNTTIDSAKSETEAKQLKSAKNDVISTTRRHQIIKRDVLNNRLEDKQTNSGSTKNFVTVVLLPGSLPFL